MCFNSTTSIAANCIYIIVMLYVNERNKYENKSR